MAKNAAKSEAELRHEIANSRAVVAREVRGLSYEADIPAKIRRSFTNQTGVWVAGALALGLVVTLMPRTKKVVIEAKTADQQKKKLIESGLVLAALKMAINLARPALMKFVQHKMTGGGASARPRRGSW